MLGKALPLKKSFPYHTIYSKVINNIVNPRNKSPTTSLTSSFTIASQIQKHILGSRCLVRYSSANATPCSKSEPSSARTAPPSPLDWEIFFQLRKKRRLYHQFFSVFSGIGGVISGAQVLMYANTDAIVSQLHLDPFIGVGLITFISGGIGWLLGPVAGTAVFNWQHRDLKSQIDEREKEFYRRVRRYRVDPSNSSMANPVPGTSYHKSILNKVNLF